MDPKLAEIYGTNEVSEYDVEKLAAAELAEELSESDDADIDGMTEDDVEALAAQVLAEEQGEEYDEEYSDESVDEESMEKISEADYLGRVMAHSYVQELRNIDGEMEKEARWQHRTEAGREAFRPGKGHKTKADRQTAAKFKNWSNEAIPKKPSSSADRTVNRNAARAKLEQGRVSKAVGAEKAKGFGARMKGHAQKAWGSVKGNAMKAGRYAKSHPGRVGAALGGAALLGGGAYAMGKKKESSALDVLAERRALEILELNGIDPNELIEGNDGYEKVSSAEEVLGGAVEQRAWDILSQYGLEPSDEE